MSNTTHTGRTWLTIPHDIGQAARAAIAKAVQP